MLLSDLSSVRRSKLVTQRHPGSFIARLLGLIHISEAERAWGEGWFSLELGLDFVSTGKRLSR